MEQNYPEVDEVYQGIGSFILEIVKIFILALIIIIPIRVFLFQPFFVQGDSMVPNFENNQYLIINELGYKTTAVGLGDKIFFTVKPFREIKRQMVIVFRYPLDRKKYFIKRIIGMPGEKIEIKNGQIYIYNKENPNGYVLNEEDYLMPGIKTVNNLNNNSNITLKDDEYFVMGDNRMASSDSRSWGPIKKTDIIGTVIFRAWPLTKIKVF